MKYVRLILTILAAMILITGCDNNPNGIAPGNDITGLNLILNHNLTHAEILELMDYETFTGSLDQHSGGGMLCVPATWPGDCMFSIFVPIGAVPPGPPVEFTLQIPTYASYMEFREFNLPMIMRLGPEDVQFEEQLIIQGTWMPWDKRTPDHFWHFIDGGQDEVTPFRATKMPNGLWNCVAHVDHFSDWEFGPLTPKAY